VATTLLVAGPTLTWAGSGLHPPARTQASFKGTRLLIPLMHVTWWPCCSTDYVWGSHGGQKKTKHYYSTHNIATRESFCM